MKLQAENCAERSLADPKSRSGAMIVEGAIILSGLLLVLLAMLDVGLAVMQSNTLVEAARALARESATHGASATPYRTCWGPASYSGHAGDGSEVAETIRGLFVIGDPEDVNILIDWPQGGNDVDQSVRVTLTLTRPPMVPWGSLTGDYEFRSVTEMIIQN